MQWGEIWTPGVQDGVISGLVCTLVAGAVGLIWAWGRNWRMRNPLAWFVSTMKEDASLNLGAFCCSCVLIAALTVLLMLDASPSAPEFLLALVVVAISAGLFFWLTFFIGTLKTNSTRPLFYKYQAKTTGNQDPDNSETPTQKQAPVPTPTADAHITTIYPISVALLGKFADQESKSFSELLAGFGLGNAGLVARELEEMERRRFISRDNENKQDIVYSLTMDGIQQLHDQQSKGIIAGVQPAQNLAGNMLVSGIQKVKARDLARASREANTPADSESMDALTVEQRVLKHLVESRSPVTVQVIAGVISHPVGHTTSILKDLIRRGLVSMAIDPVKGAYYTSTAQGVEFYKMDAFRH